MLQSELDQRGWSGNQLAVRAGIDRGIISRALNRERMPSPESLKSIAGAFGYPVERIYRAAGLLPPISESNAWKERIIHLAEQLPEEEYNDLVAYIEMRIRLSKEREKASASKRAKPITG
jgi:transcriptional regulator with XRE-family HTH domain